MKIERELVRESTLEDFANDNLLTMKVYERSAEFARYTGHRFHAAFLGCEIGGDGMLRSASGNGNTEAEAINDYARTISEQYLIIDAYKPSRREIRAPRLVGSHGNSSLSEASGSAQSAAPKEHSHSGTPLSSMTVDSFDALIAAVRQEGQQEIEQKMSWFHDLDDKGRCRNSKCYECERRGLQERIKFTESFEAKAEKITALEAEIERLKARLRGEKAGRELSEYYHDRVREEFDLPDPSTNAIVDRLRDEIKRREAAESRLRDLDH